MKVLVLGASGMLGNTLVRVLSENTGWEVYGTLRSESFKRFFDKKIAKRLLSGIDIEHHDSLVQAFAQVKPHVAINCIGLVKQQNDADNPLHAIPMNALFPHQLSRLCELSGTRLIHLSTDCVFSGQRGNYNESDFPDALDLYGRSKLLGEVSYPHTITLRTSIIGHEIHGKQGLLEWFLLQENQCYGYTKAIFSGFPTVILSQIIRDIILLQPDLSGIYHVGSQAISKYDLLTLVARIYNKRIEIIEDGEIVIDRSLDASRFNALAGYTAPSWETMIKKMHAYK